MPILSLVSFIGGINTLFQCIFVTRYSRYVMTRRDVLHKRLLPLIITSSVTTRFFRQSHLSSIFAKVKQYVATIERIIEEAARVQTHTPCERAHSRSTCSSRPLDKCYNMRSRSTRCRVCKHTRGPCTCPWNIYVRNDGCTIRRIRTA